MLLSFCLLGNSIQAAPQEYRLLDTDELSLEYSKLNPENRDPYAPQYTGKWRERAAILWDSTLIGKDKYRLFWNHNIHTETIDSGAVKTVGWEWWAGISLGRIDVMHHHHSRHIMDERIEHPEFNGKTNQFPVEDSLVVRIRFIQKEK